VAYTVSVTATTAGGTTAPSGTLAATPN
jgi:hypothetical protein